MDMIKLYSKSNAIVWDGFCGSGVVPRIAKQLGRRGIGTDVNPKAIDLAKRHDKDGVYWVEDVRDVRLEEKADLILSSAPFGLKIAGDKNNYSDEPTDLSNANSYEDFFNKLKDCFENYFNQLKPNGVCILDARDRSKDGEYFDLINYFRNMCLDVGFEILCRYYYELIPWVQWTSKDKDTGFVKPMPDAMDVIVLKKPVNERLN